MGFLQCREFGRMATMFTAVCFFVGGVAWRRETAPISVFFVRFPGRNASEPMRHRGFFWLSSAGFPREKKWRVLMDCSTASDEDGGCVLVPTKQGGPTSRRDSRTAQPSHTPPTRSGPPLGRRDFGLPSRSTSKNNPGQRQRNQEREVAFELGEATRSSARSSARLGLSDVHSVGSRRGKCRTAPIPRIRHLSRKMGDADGPPHAFAMRASHPQFRAGTHAGPSPLAQLLRSPCSSLRPPASQVGSLS
jgi:hypothetical protein